ncbi:hypothetical protein FA15DRAFT_605358, partial [Coprinopsis marcescibilis]
VPGPFNDSNEPQECVGLYFGEQGAGPFTSYAAMAKWFDDRRLQVINEEYECSGKLSYPVIPKFDRSRPLRMCHMDLNMRNVVVDSWGKVWLIDWERAGAYSEWMKYALWVLWSDAAHPGLSWGYWFLCRV